MKQKFYGVTIVLAVATTGFAQDYAYDSFDTKVNGSALATGSGGQNAEGGTIGGTWGFGYPTTSDPTPTWTITQGQSLSPKQSVEGKSNLSANTLMTDGGDVETDLALPHGTTITGSYSYSADMLVGSLNDMASGIDLGGSAAFMGGLYFNQDGSILAGAFAGTTTAFLASGNMATWSSGHWHHLEMDVVYSNSSTGLFSIGYKVDGQALYNSSGALIVSQNSTANYVRALGLDLAFDPAGSVSNPSADVFFDNVNLQAVPEPYEATVLAGLAFLAVMRRKAR